MIESLCGSRYHQPFAQDVYLLFVPYVMCLNHFENEIGWSNKADQMLPIQVGTLVTWIEYALEMVIHL